MNAYINLVHKKARIYTIPSFSHYEETFPFTNKFHWVWFRKDRYKLKQKQFDCVKSWVKLNPELEYNLWTDIEHETELRDFLSELPEKETEFFFGGSVKVRHLSQVLEFLNSYFEKHSKDKAIRFFDFSVAWKLAQEKYATVA